VRLLFFALFCAVRAAMALFAHLPFPFAVFLGSLMARVWQRNLNSTCVKNLTACYGAAAWDKNRLRSFSRARAQYFSRLGVVLGRLLAARPASLRGWSVLAGEDVLRQALARNRGAIMLGPHFGLWLLGPAILAAHGYECAVVIRHLSSRHLERASLRLARRHGVKLIHVGRDAIPAIHRALYENRVICIAFDTPLRKGASARYRFGSGALRLDHGPAVLALRHRVPILFGIIPAGKTRQVEFQIEAAASAIGSSATTTPDALMQAWCGQTYEHVTRQPDQWLRWNDRDAIEPGLCADETQRPATNRPAAA